MRYLFVIFQVILVVSIAPLISGVIRKIKNNLRMRKGPGIIQPYYNIAKLMAKDEVVSGTTSWIFKITPFIVLGSVISALFLVPFFGANLYMERMGGLLLIVFMLGAGRFFIALAGLDAGGSFGGMGSSREMFISALAEPVAVMSIFAVSLKAGSTNIALVSASGAISLSSIIAALAMFMVIVAETSRVPVDNQETHLELTMVHEAMILEYSGRSLAFIELAAHIKQILLFSILANVFLPWGVPPAVTLGNIFSASAIYFVKIMILCIFTALIEISVAKMRLFRVVDFMSFAFVLSLMAFIVAAMGL